MCHGWSMQVNLMPGTSTAPASYGYNYVTVDPFTNTIIEQNSTGIFTINSLYADGGYYFVYGVSYDPLDPSCFQFTDSIIPFYAYPLLLVQLVPGSLSLDSINCLYEFDVSVTGGCGGGYDIELLAGDYFPVNDTLFHVYNIPSTDPAYIIDAKCHIGCSLESTLVIPPVFCPPPIIHVVVFADTVYNYELVGGVLYIDTVYVFDTVTFTTPSAGDYSFVDITNSVDSVFIIDQSGLAPNAADTIFVYDTVTVTSISVIVDSVILGGVTAYDSLIVYHQLTVVTLTMSSLMPLHLAYFNAKPETQCNSISWLDYAWDQNAFYEILKSNTGFDFKPAATIEATATNLGAFIYSDCEVEAGLVYYQLKSTEPNGYVTLSDIISVRRLGIDPNFTIVNSPNSIIIQCNQSANAATFSIIQTNGAIVSQGDLTLGNNLININTLSAGIYFIKIMHGSEATVHKVCVE
jgi:hypothetical protein